MQRKREGGTTTVPVPDHREIREGTLLSIIRQSGVPRTEFEKGEAHGRRSHGERGYVLMVFMLFAALLLVSASTIVRQAAFEGRRQKEAELVFRGLQYHRAVQLFFRKFGRYPNSVDELEKTNNIRFLRKRYADPMTKEGEWRLIHVGPNGAFVDAQTSPLQMPRAPGQQGAPSTQQSGTTEPTTQTSTFQPGGQAAQVGFQSSFGQNPGQVAMGLNPISSSAGPSPLPQGFSPQPGQSMQPALLPSASPSAFPQQAQAGGTTFGQQPQGSVPSAAQPQPIGGSLPVSTTGGLQTFGGMAIAGFASMAKGSSIRIWNGYDDYSKWEFIYDFRQDQLAMARFAAQNPPAVQPGAQVPPGQMPPGTQPAFQPPGFQPPGTGQPGFQPGFQPRPGSLPFVTPGMPPPGVQQPGPGVPPFTPPGFGPGTPPSPFSPTPGALPPPRTR